MKILFLAVIILLSCVVHSQDSKDFLELFGDVEQVSLKSQDLSDYFFEITERYSFKEYENTYTSFFAFIENDTSLLEDDLFKVHYALFTARVYRLAQKYNESYNYLNDIGDNQSGFTQRDSLNYLVMLHITTLKIGLYQQSIEYAQRIRGLKNIPSTRPDNFAPDIYWLVGSDFSYNAMGDYKSAIREAKIAFSAYRKLYHEDYFFLYNRANNIGVYYNNDNKPDSALVYFNEALQFLDNYDANFPKPKEFYEAFVKGNIAQSYMLRGDFTAAIPLLLDDIKRSKNHIFENAIVSTLLLAQCYAELGEIEKAKLTMLEFDGFSETTVANLSLKYKVKLYTVRARIAQLSGDLSNSITIYNELLSYNDSVNRVQMATRALALQTAFDFENKEQELNESLFRERDLKEQLIRRRNIIMGSFLVALFLLSIIFFYRRNVIKQKRIARELQDLNHKVEENSIIIENTLEEKETLLKEIHHRVKNNLQVVSSLLSLQGNSITNIQAKEALMDGQTRVRSMALVHQRLYETDNFKDVNFEDYNIQLVQNLIASYEGGSRVSYLITSNEVIDIDIAMPLGLIVNEIVTNTLKYCKNQEKVIIDIKFKKIDDNYHLDISDDGSGFNLEEAKKKRTLGIKLIEILVKQLEGKLILKTSKQESTSYSITFPTNS